MNQNPFYLPSDKIDQYLDNLEQEQNKAQEECKVQCDMYSMKKIDSLDSLFQLFNNLIKFDMFFLNQQKTQISTIVTDKKLRQSNILMLKYVFLQRMREEIRRNEYKEEQAIFQFLVQRSSDNPLILEIGKSIFKETLLNNSDMIVLFQDVFGYECYNEFDFYNFLDFQLTGSVRLDQNKDKKLGFRAQFKHQRQKLYIKDCMELVKSMIVFSFIFDILMNTLFVLSGKTLEYSYQLDLICGENCSGITTLKGLLNQVQKCYYYIRIVQADQICEDKDIKL